jgi:hypothetical protein
VVKLIFTIDDEVGDGSREIPFAFETVLQGKNEGLAYGSPLISSMLKEYNIRGNFFLSVLEANFFGDKLYEKHAQKLMYDNHEVDLHTHPIYWNKNKRFMHEYSLKEQKLIIQSGLETLIRYTGKLSSSVVHRAGSYSVNFDSYLALAELGILYDSSYYEASECKVWDFVKNNKFDIHGVKVFPVTALPFPVKKKSISLPFFKKNLKLDLNQQSVSLIKEMIKRPTDLEYIMIFLHSFSFLKLTKTYEVAGINYNLISDFTDLLKFITYSGIETATIQEIESV